MSFSDTELSLILKHGPFEIFVEDVGGFGSMRYSCPCCFEGFTEKAGSEYWDPQSVSVYIDHTDDCEFEAMLVIKRKIEERLNATKVA